MNEYIVGIDPGVRGGASLFRACDGHLPVLCAAVSFAGKTETELFASLLCLQMEANAKKSKVVCYIEKVGYIKGDGPMGSFTFGKVYGLLRGMSIAMGWELHSVPPVIWQSRLQCLSGGNKRVTLNVAKEMFGDRDIKITHATADAILIGYFGVLNRTTRDLA